MQNRITFGNNMVSTSFPISFNKIHDVFTPDGATYNVVNTSSSTPTAGNLHIQPSGLTLRINAIDANGGNHFEQISALPVGTVITIGVETCTLVGTPIHNAGVFSLMVDVLPVVTDGTYQVKATIQ